MKRPWEINMSWWLKAAQCWFPSIPSFKMLPLDCTLHYEHEEQLFWDLNDNPNSQWQQCFCRITLIKWNVTVETDQLNLLQGRSDTSYRIGISVSARSGSIKGSGRGWQGKWSRRALQRSGDAGCLHSRCSHWGRCDVETRHSSYFSITIYFVLSGFNGWENI